MKAPIICGVECVGHWTLCGVYVIPRVGETIRICGADSTKNYRVTEVIWMIDPNKSDYPALQMVDVEKIGDDEEAPIFADLANLLEAYKQGADRGELKAFLDARWPA